MLSYNKKRVKNAFERKINMAMRKCDDLKRKTLLKFNQFMRMQKFHDFFKVFFSDDAQAD